METTLSYPASCTTTDGVTHVVKDKIQAEVLGLSGKKWEVRRGGYFEVGCRPYKDGRVSVGASEAAKQRAEADKRAPEPEEQPPLDAVDDEVVLLEESPPESPKKKTRRRS